MSWSSVAAYSLVGTLTSPNDTAPFHIARGMSPLSQSPVTTAANLPAPPKFHVSVINMKSDRAYVMTERARSTQENGERILEATIALFAELPYAQLTLRAVADRADVTVQTVIRRFGDKEGLTVAAAARSREHIAHQRSAAPVGDLAGAVDNLVTHYEEAGDLALRLLSEEQTAPQLAEL